MSLDNWTYQPGDTVEVLAGLFAGRVGKVLMVTGSGSVAVRLPVGTERSGITTIAPDWLKPARLTCGCWGRHEVEEEERE